MGKVQWGSLITALCALAVAATVATVAVIQSTQDPLEPGLECSNQCEFEVVESRPFMLTALPPVEGVPLTHDVFSDLIQGSQKSLEIAALYWDLSDGAKWPQYNGNWGNNILQQIAAAGKRGVDVRIAQNMPSAYFPSTDSINLEIAHLAQLRNLSMPDITGQDGGVLHTKCVIKDEDAFYVGSANMDWKSLAMVKELGIHIRNCPCLTKQIRKIFSTYWIAGTMEGTPSHWPNDLTTSVNMNTPVLLDLTQIGTNASNAGTPGSLFLSISPPALIPPGWTHDLDALLNLFNTASEYIKIEVMDYYPESRYTTSKSYWPVIGDALKAAAFERGVDVYFLAGYWNHTNLEMIYFLNSLQAAGDACKVQKSCTGSITVNMFQFPEIPLDPQVTFVMVNHAKFVVTDSGVFISTSNWTKDYFYNTGGISLVTNNPLVKKKVLLVFDRDWESPYSKSVTNFLN